MCTLFIYITICLCFVTVTSTVPETYRNLDLEKLDEHNDVEIFKAVVNSIREWERKKILKEKYGSRTKRQTEGVCYPDLGCFESSGPFSYLDMLPGTPDEIGTKFLMYPGHAKRRSGSPAAEVPFGNLTDAFTWAKRGFNHSLPTKVMVHGFGSDCSHIWVYELRSALMAVEEANIICVDWSNGATLPNYVKATANTRLVGKQLSMLLKGLVDNNGLSLRKLHLIGFSLGAHVAGFAGAELGNLSRITGLDPAGPLFESQDPRARLDQTDAEFVDVIHSNGENLILGGLGSWQPMGHVDFYPNGGRMQKGCSNIFVGAVSDIIWSSAIEGRSLCNHRRAYKFFTDSVSPRCHFPAFPCDSYEAFLDGKCFPCVDGRNCGNMGYYADRSKGRGQLYLVTRDEEPFCAYQYLLKVESSPSEFPIITYGRMQVTLVGDSLLNETFTLTKKDDEEFKMGDSISRIIVPHPILLEPAKIHVIYNAYSGWLTSGLLQWKIDKVTLSDSFGKTYSVCKRNLILDSGIPVTLRLYPGDCNVPKENFTAEDRIEINNDSNTKHSNFIPTPVVKIGNEIVPNEPKESDTYRFSNTIDVFNNNNWPNEKENRVDSDVESSRAFNTRIIVKAPINTTNETEIIREIVEPILKPHTGKIGRSHDLNNNNKDKSEISEPILGPTTTKTTTIAQELKTTTDPASSTTARKPTTSKIGVLRKSLNSNDVDKYNYYDIHMENDWIPATSVRPEKWKRQDDSRAIPLAITDNNQRREPERVEEGGGLNAIVRTVQFLPQRIARMLEEAEKYARERILPLVSNYTPRFISDFITQRDRTRYIPVNHEETTITPTTTESSTTNCPNHQQQENHQQQLNHHQQENHQQELNNHKQEIHHQEVNQQQQNYYQEQQPQQQQQNHQQQLVHLQQQNRQLQQNHQQLQNQQQQQYYQHKKQEDNVIINNTNTDNSVNSDNRSLATHIQKIPKKYEKITIIYPVSAVIPTTTTEAIPRVAATSKSSIDDTKHREDARSNNNNEEADGNREYTSKREIKEIRIELPVFEEDQKIMYIPIHEELIKDKK